MTHYQLNGVRDPRFETADQASRGQSELQACDASVERHGG